MADPRENHNRQPLERIPPEIQWMAERARLVEGIGGQDCLEFAGTLPKAMLRRLVRFLDSGDPNIGRSFDRSMPDQYWLNFDGQHYHITFNRKVYLVIE